MKLIVKTTPGELYSIFLSIHFACNLNEIKGQIEEQWGMKIDAELEEDIKNIIDNKLFDLGRTRKFFDININSQELFMDSEFLWISKDVDEYFKNLRSQSPEDMRQKLIKGLAQNYSEAALHDEKINNLQDTIKFLDRIPIENEIKWSLLCIIEDPNTYVEEFIQLINTYLPLYNEIREKNDEKFKNFIMWIEEELRIHGTDFLSNNLGILDFRQFEEVYLSYSLFSLCTINASAEEKRCYLSLGPLFQQYLQQTIDKQDVEQHLMVYKNFSDKTRFEIIRLLIKEESFGQQIAEKLGITTATVSYHMNYLLGASLVKMTKKNRKVFYSINKDRIMESILFLKEELRL